jgi:hypothetical protein
MRMATELRSSCVRPAIARQYRSLGRGGYRASGIMGIPQTARRACFRNEVRPAANRRPVRPRLPPWLSAFACAEIAFLTGLRGVFTPGSFKLSAGKSKHSARIRKLPPSVFRSNGGSCWFRGGKCTFLPACRPHHLRGDWILRAMPIPPRDQVVGREPEAAAWERPPSSPSANPFRTPGGCESAERAGSFSGCWSVCCSWSVKPCTSSLLDLGSAREERSGRSCLVSELGERLAGRLSSHSLVMVSGRQI